MLLVENIWERANSTLGGWTKALVLALVASTGACDDGAQTDVSTYAGDERDLGAGVLASGDVGPTMPVGPAADDAGGPEVGVDGAGETQPRDMGRPPPEELPEGDEECAALALCLRDCAREPECDAACRDAASPASVMRYDAYTACAFNAGCSEPGGRFNAACVEARCFIERATCFGPPPPPPPEGMGVLRCPDFVYCVDNCPPMDGVCRDDCYRSARPEVAGQYASVQACLETCPASDYACRANACRAQMLLCYGPQPAGPMGMETCPQLDLCVLDCNANNEICIERCYAASSPEGYNAYFGLDACVTVSGCDAADRACAQMACEAQWVECFGVGPMGMGNCRDLYACSELCGDDGGCVEACVVDANVEAHMVWLVADACMRDAGCRAADAACIRDNCAPEMEACVGPPNPAMGNAPCREFDLCLLGCSGNRFCIMQCIEMASPAAYDAHRAIRDCWAAEACGGGQPGCCEAEEQACDDN